MSEREQVSGPTEWAVAYLRDQYGIETTSGALKHRRWRGWPPRSRKLAGSRRVLYFRVDLDAWARGEQAEADR
jgi:hypothetical protein